MYRENLLLWDTTGQLFSIGLDRVRAEIERVADRHVRILADYLVLRSEIKSSSNYRDLVSIPSIRKPLFAPLRYTDDLVVELELPELLPYLAEIVPGHLTDATVYGNRVFAATDAGLFETQFNPNYPQSSELWQVTDRPSTSVVAGNGQVAMSLGEYGLLAREVSFGDGDSWIPAASNASFTSLAEYSRSVTRSSVHFLNYGESEVPDFIRAITRREPRSNGFEETVVTGFFEPAPLRERIVDAMDWSVDEARDLGGPDFEIVGNANFKLLIRRESEMHVLAMSAYHNRDIQLKADRSIALPAAHVDSIRHALSTQSLRSGFIVEHLGGVHLLTDLGLLQLADELVVQARTFPNSRRYVDTIAITRDESVDLIGFVDLDGL